jgi:hypothetical protein
LLHRSAGAHGHFQGWKNRVKNFLPLFQVKQGRVPERGVGPADRDAELIFLAEGGAFGTESLENTVRGFGSSA